MSFAFPQYDEPNALDDRRSWTARFESFDQRNEVIYYTLRLYEDGAMTSEFIGAVSYWGPEWDGPDFRAIIERELTGIAVSGTTNTEYLGSPFGAR